MLIRSQHPEPESVNVTKLRATNKCETTLKTSSCRKYK